MADLTLKRISSNPIGTFGVLINNTIPFVITRELPWYDNRKNLSCIPTGIYTCKRTNSPKFGETFEILNVPNRTNILFHQGNFIHDTQGCILVAEKFEYINNAPIISESKIGFKEFMDLQQDTDTFNLTIVIV